MKTQLRKDYPKPKKEETNKTSFERQWKLKKLRATIKKNFAILVLAAGFIRMVYLEADNQWIILGIGLLLTVALIEWSLSKD